MKLGKFLSKSFIEQDVKAGKRNIKYSQAHAHVPVASGVEEGLNPGLHRLHDVLNEVLFDVAAVVEGPVANVDGLPDC